MDHRSKRKIHAHRFPTGGGLLALLLTYFDTLSGACYGLLWIIDNHSWEPIRTNASRRPFSAGVG